MRREVRENSREQILSGGAIPRTVRLTDGTEAKRLGEWPVRFAGRPPSASRRSAWLGSNFLVDRHSSRIVEAFRGCLGTGTLAK